MISTGPRWFELSVFLDTSDSPEGSHIRLTTQRDGENHEVIPHHDPIKTGTLAAILERIAMHHGLKVEEVLRLLDL